MDVRPLVKQREGWEDNAEKYITEIVCGDIKWINVSSDKFNGGLL
jgi:hypothetical protein